MGVFSRFAGFVNGGDGARRAPGWRGARNGLLTLIVILLALGGLFLVEEGNQLNGWLGIATLFAAFLVHRSSSI